jgi:hypothetical protein
VSYPGTVALFESQQAWQAAQLAPETSPEDARTHQQELQVAHQGAPSVSEQSKTHGAGRPLPDYGPDPRGGVVG